MATIKEEAQAYEAPQPIRNIVELDSVPIDFELYDKEGKDKDKETFKYKAVSVNGLFYRIPGKVLGDIKEILKLKPDMKTFKVNKQGSGIQTSYTVIPLS